MKGLIFVCLFAFVCKVFCEGEVEEKAHLLAAKRVHNLYLVEGRDILITYSLHNIGSSAAINVQLIDSSFSTHDFDIVGGQLQVKFDRIAPSANVSHAVVIRPKKFGYYNFTAAELTYQSSEDSTEIQTGFTSEPGEGAIIAYRDYDKKFSPHVFDWIIFAFLLIPALAIPFSMWYKIKVKYELTTKPRAKRE
ncbi:UNVERIFIED_CONTAM: hypothetical protein RMT77_001795 [Armadillidium vulgare]